MIKLLPEQIAFSYRAGGPSGDRDDASDLIFRVDGKDYMIRAARIYLPDDTPPNSQAYEDYWDDPANVQRAIDEADEIEEIT